MHQRLLIASALRALAVAAGLGLLSFAVPYGFWACVPGALLLAARARGPAGAAASVAVAVGAATLAPLPGGAPQPPLLGLAVALSSVAVLHGVRMKLERERDSMRCSAQRDPLTGAWN